MEKSIAPFFRFMVLQRDLNSKAPPSDERGKAAMDGGLRRRVAAKAMDGLSAAGAWMRRSGRSAHREVRARAGQIPPSAPWQYLKGFRLEAEIPFFVKTRNVARGVNRLSILTHTGIES